MTSRSQAPAIRPVEHLEFPSPARFTLPGGTVLTVLDRAQVPVVRLDLVFGLGSLDEPVPLTASFAMAMIRRGTRDMSQEQIARRLDFCGASMEGAVYQDYSVLTVYTMNRFLDEILDITVGMLTSPLFGERELEHFRDNRLQAFLERQARTDHQSRAIFKSRIFGQDHPLGRRLSPGDFQAVDRQALVDFFSSFLRKGSSRSLLGAYASGMVRQRELDLIRRALDGFLAPSVWPAPRNLPSLPPPPRGTEPQVILHPVPGARQMSLTMGCLSLERSHEDYLDLCVLIALLGGSFSSRLNLSLRQERGLTYGVSALMTDFPGTGLLSVCCDFDFSYREEVLGTIRHEMEALSQDPCGDAELELLRCYLTGSLSRSLENVFSLADLCIDLDASGLELDYIHRRLDAMNRITPERLMALARRYLRPGAMTCVLAGA